MWDISKPAKRWGDASLSPTRVLYEFDGPLIFTVQLGLQDVLFFKADELDETDLFLATQIDEETLEALTAGRLSVRGAFLKDSCWIVEVSHSFEPLRFWTCDYEEVPEDLLPQQNVPLYSQFVRAPDTIEQSEAFFAIGFQGEDMTTSSMLFSTFRNLVNEAYDTARRILSPELLKGSRSTTFDFPIYEPKFGSLIIALKEPVLDAGNIRRKMGNANAPMEYVHQQIDQQRANFFEDLDKIVSDSEDISDEGDIETRISFLEDIRSLLPNKDTPIRSVEFSFKAAGEVKSVFIDREAGEKIKNTYLSSEGDFVSKLGVIEVINRPSRTFVMTSTEGKQITCGLTLEQFTAMLEKPAFKMGARISVEGLLWERVKRDYLRVRGLPVLLDPRFNLRENSL
jgi:hypothetical protein